MKKLRIRPALTRQVFCIKRSKEKATPAQQRKREFGGAVSIPEKPLCKSKGSRVFAFCIYETKSKLLNENTGFDIKYQENKVFNLRLAAKPVNGILIRPGKSGFQGRNKTVKKALLPFYFSGANYLN